MNGQPPLTAFSMYLHVAHLAPQVQDKYVAKLRRYLAAHPDDVTGENLQAWCLALPPTAVPFFRAAWRHFRTFATERGLDDLPDLPAAPPRRPEAVDRAIAFLFHSFPTRTRYARWHQIQFQDVGGLVNVGRTARSWGGFGPEGKAALLVVRRWAYGDVEPLPDSYVFPASPKRQKPISRESLRNLRARFSQVVAQSSSG